MSELNISAEIFNRNKQRVDDSGSAVIRQIMSLLKPNEGYPKTNDSQLKILYSLWQSECRAMDAACKASWNTSKQKEMIEMPPDDEEHRPCRQMAAAIIEREIYDEFVSRHSLADASDYIRRNIEACRKHPKTCACHELSELKYAKNDLAKETTCQCVACTGSGRCLSIPDISSYTHSTENCACGSCHRYRMANGTAEGYRRRCREAVDAVLSRLKDAESSVPRAKAVANLLGKASAADDAICLARAMPGGSTDDGFVKNILEQYPS